jgi:hypothetical protein
VKLHGQTATSLILLAITINCACYAQGIRERENILSALTMSYGEPLDKHHLLFQLNSTYLLTPYFSDDGILTKISIDPKYGLGSAESPPMSRVEFEKILANLNSIKPLGTFEEDFSSAFVSGGRVSDQNRYENGYLDTSGPITEQPPRSVAAAKIYYLHSVKGSGRVPKDSKPKDAGSFGLVCFKGKAYIAPQTDFLKLYENPGTQLTLWLAGPTGDASSVCLN